MSGVEISDPSFLVKPPKKPRTEKQKVATENALKKLQERRLLLAKEKAEKDEEKRKLTAQTNHTDLESVQVPHIVKPRSHKPKKPDYFTKDDMNQFMGRIESLLTKTSEPKIESPVAPLDPPPENPVEIPKPRVKEPAQPRIPRSEPTLNSLTGHALLDKLFFHQ